MVDRGGWFRDPHMAHWDQRTDGRPIAAMQPQQNGEKKRIGDKDATRETT